MEATRRRSSAGSAMGCAAGGRRRGTATIRTGASGARTAAPPDSPRLEQRPDPALELSDGGDFVRRERPIEDREIVVEAHVAHPENDRRLRQIPRVGLLPLHLALEHAVEIKA